MRTIRYYRYLRTVMGNSRRSAWRTARYYSIARSL